MEVNRIHSIFAGFCPLVKILGRFGYDKATAVRRAKTANSAADHQGES